MTYTDDIRAKYQPAAGSAMDRVLKTIDASAAAEQTARRENDAVAELRAAAAARLDDPVQGVVVADLVDVTARSLTILEACDHVERRMERAIRDAAAATAISRRALSVMTNVLDGHAIQLDTAGKRDSSAAARAAELRADKIRRRYLAAESSQNDEGNDD